MSALLKADLRTARLVLCAVAKSGLSYSIALKHDDDDDAGDAIPGLFLIMNAGAAWKVRGLSLLIV
ncbi:hypothetical protein [Sphingobium nicotianae]|uniref:Uncharacterized protein n=1 Tax=Sphingobium nicotianae TaxID=2782607 RepID=A0A9X1DA72_9SPHN|nr:hypothetical protein [Sphingobium nicotianae]MBT2186218.1 hypothetical protein [Sphingobium nicotianae]